VYVFGSAAAGEMDEYSDIDLAVAGLPPEAFFRAYARASEHLPGRETDLVNLDSDTPSLPEGGAGAPACGIGCANK